MLQASAKVAEEPHLFARIYDFSRRQIFYLPYLFNYFQSLVVTIVLHKPSWARGVEVRKTRELGLRDE